MNVPEYRSTLAGRTWSEPWNPVPIEHHKSRKHFEVIDALFAIALGLSGAATLFCWLSK